jgi:diguanylate cyclase (GGDEF)-like protein/PAS domain S-box-containing protein
MFKDKVIYSNPAFEKLIGYSGKELLNLDFLDLIIPQQQENFQEHIQTPLTRKVNHFELIVQLQTKKSTKRWVKIKTKLIVQDDQQEYLSIVTNISNEKLEIDKLHQLAYFDALTGIYNRRKFNEILDAEYKRSKRYQRSLCGLFFDIDYFKAVNDTYGHDAGDDVLKTLAQKVSQHIRETDCFARWGGEEFIILLPESNQKQALATAEHLRETINNVIFTKVGKISISIGITILKENERVKTFIKRLDDALYKAKKEGRNRSIII